MLTFVTYYVKPPPEELERLKTVYQLTHHKNYIPESNPDEIISIMFASVKKFHPNARCCLLTDKESQFKLDPSIEIIRYPRKTYKLDMEVLRALIYYIKTSKEEVNTIFLEWDQIVQGDVGYIFKKKADLYFAFRRIPPVPFDDAFIGIGSGHFESIADFFKMIINEYRCIASKKLRYWLGKSLILSLMLFDHYLKRAGTKSRIVGFKWNDLFIVTLSGKKFSKKLVQDELTEYQKDSLILHFSNKKRQYLKQYWEKFVKDRGNCKKS